MQEKETSEIKLAELHQKLVMCCILLAMEELGKYTLVIIYIYMCVCVCVCVCVNESERVRERERERER